MLDQGFGRGDLALRLQQLKFYLRAVVNAILDHQMHAGTMNDQQAMELLVGRAFQTEGEAVGKIIRAKQTSCQLSTYFVGRLAFYRLAAASSARNGGSIRPRALSRSCALARHDSGQISSRAGSRIARSGEASFGETLAVVRRSGSART